MSRRSNKWIAEILTPSTSSPPVVDIAALTHGPSPSQSCRSNSNDNSIDDLSIERKITIATEGFTTHKFCELVLKDRNRLSKENALTVCDYVIAMKREVNPRLSYKRYTIQVLSELSKAVGLERNLSFDEISGGTARTTGQGKRFAISQSTYGQHRKCSCCNSAIAAKYKARNVNQTATSRNK